MLPLVGAVSGRASLPRLLDCLLGHWEMVGEVMSKPVTYYAKGSLILQGQFLAFHVVNAAVPSTYEANLLVGIDSSKSYYDAHAVPSNV